MSAAAVFAPRRTFESGALGQHSFFRPKVTLVDYLFYALEPARHCRMIEQVIKLLTNFIRTECSVVHLWSVLSVSPAFIWGFWHLFC